VRVLVSDSDAVIRFSKFRIPLGIRHMCGMFDSAKILGRGRFWQVYRIWRIPLGIRHGAKCLTQQKCHDVADSASLSDMPNTTRNPTPVRNVWLSKNCHDVADSASFLDTPNTTLNPTWCGMSDSAKMSWRGWFGKFLDTPNTTRESYPGAECLFFFWKGIFIDGAECLTQQKGYRMWLPG